MPEWALAQTKPLPAMTGTEMATQTHDLLRIAQEKKKYFNEFRPHCVLEAIVQEKAKTDPSRERP
jgi:hypothetical protein